MSLVALDGSPLIVIGAPLREGMPYLGTAAGASTSLDAANEACIIVGQIVTEDGGSHTIDTSGSSSLGWRSGAVTFADGSTTVKVGLAAVDTATGPPARAANAANVITFDVSKSLTGGGGITSNAWQEHVPDAGTKTIANGDLVAFAVQMTARGGSDIVPMNNQAGVTGFTYAWPVVVSYLGGTYLATTNLANAVITFSDGTRGYFLGSHVYLTGTSTQTWNSGSATKEYGNFFQLSAPVKVYGFVANVAIGGDTDLVLYSDPLGTPVAEKTISVDANAIGTATAGRIGYFLFSSPYEATADQPLAGIMKPTTGTNISSVYKTFELAAHQASDPLGENCYAVNRNTGAFAAQNSSKDRFALGLLVAAFDDGAGGGGGGIGALVGGSLVR